MDIETLHVLTSKFEELYKLKTELEARLEAASVKVAEQEAHISQSFVKYEEAEARTRKLQTDIQTLHVPTSKFEELLKSKTEVEAKFEASSAKVAVLESQIIKLSAEVQAAMVELDVHENKAASITGQVDALKHELSQTRDRLNRARTGLLKEYASQKGSEPVAVARLAAPAAAAGRRLQRRHSSAGHCNDAGVRDSVDERMIAGKQGQANNPRAVSVAYHGLDGLPRYRKELEIDGNPAEESVRLLSDFARLDQEMKLGLIMGIKIPSPMSANAPSLKEVFFPANLISLISNEMWRCGMIKESEQFLANTMLTIQEHVMVSFKGN
ncbi:class V myosin protein, putative, partial [Rhizoctonia solani AG-3 Rhs1AP]